MLRDAPNSDEKIGFVTSISLLIVLETLLYSQSSLKIAGTCSESIAFSLARANSFLVGDLDFSSKNNGSKLLISLGDRQLISFN